MCVAEFRTPRFVPHLRAHATLSHASFPDHITQSVPLSEQPAHALARVRLYFLLCLVEDNVPHDTAAEQVEDKLTRL